MFKQEQSPLDYLAAFAISFAAGALASAALNAYANYVRKQQPGHTPFEASSDDTPAKA